MLCVVGVYKIHIKNCSKCFVKCVRVVGVLMNWAGLWESSLKRPTVTTMPKL